MGEGRIMVISSNTLFHFTNSMRNLISILKLEFHPKFCLEDFQSVYPEQISEEAVPMVCFCDLPLSSVGKHLEFYGSYGIGMTKNWGIRNGINPVIYTYKGSSLAKYFKVLLYNSPFGLSTTAQFSLFEAKSFIKPCEGKIYRQGAYHNKGKIYRQGAYHNRKFYDEREWRYIPYMGPRTGKPHDNRTYRLKKEEYLDFETLLKENRAIGEKYKIPFQPKDIKYIIVKKETEILQMIKDVENIKGKRFSADTIRTLSSRIISAEHIQTDF